MTLRFVQIEITIRATVGKTTGRLKIGEEMITEGYFGQIKNYPETDWLICVARKYPWFVKKDVMSHFPSLAPSKELLADWKAGNIDWDTYDSRFRLEIGGAGQSVADLAYLGIKDEQGETMRLMCWEKNPPCHRFILLDLMEGFIIRGSSGSAKIE